MHSQPQLPLPLQLPLQQSVGAVHDWPALLQQFLLVPQVSPLQQSAPLPQGLPAAEHPHAPVPALHIPEQQSPAALQDVPSGMQPHFPVELQNGLGPQQSLFVPQFCPVLEQPQADVAELQTLVQHWPGVVQGCPSLTQGT